MSWNKRKRRKRYYPEEPLVQPVSRLFDYSKMCSLLLEGTYDEFKEYSNKYKLGDDFIVTTWNLYRKIDEQKD